jgi:hypothetical protein
MLIDGWDTQPMSVRAVVDALTGTMAIHSLHVIKLFA